MVTCSCGKTLDKIPAWMSGIQVDFVCNNCPNRQTKNIAFMTLEPGGAVAGATAAPKFEVEDDLEVEDEE